MKNDNKIDKDVVFGVTLTVVGIIGIFVYSFYNAQQAYKYHDQHLIQPAVVAAHTSKQALRALVEKEIQTAAANGRTDDSLYLPDYNLNEVRAVAEELVSKGYAVRFEVTKDEYGHVQPSWLRFAWDHQDEFIKSFAGK